MYKLLELSYGRSQVPLADPSLFHATIERLPAETIKLLLVEHEGQPVTAGISLVYKGLIFAWYGGTQRIKGITPFDCLTWEEIRWGNENGCSVYDFGGAGWPNEDYGPRKYKSKFGSQLVHYGRYRKVYSTLKLALAESAYKAARSMIAPPTTPSVAQ